MKFSCAVLQKRLLNLRGTFAEMQEETDFCPKEGKAIPVSLSRKQ